MNKIMSKITSKVTSKLLWRNVGFGGAIVFGVFAVFACLLSFFNKGESMTAFIVSYALIAVCGAGAMAVGGIQYWKVSGKAEPGKEKPGKKREPEKAKAVVKQRPKIQKPKWLLSLKERLGSLKKLFGDLLGSLKKKVGKKPEETAEKPAQVEEPPQAEIPGPIEVTGTEEAAQAEEVEVAAPSDEFFEAIPEEEAGEGDAALDAEVGGAIEDAEVNGALSQEKKESEPKASAKDDDFVELTPVDEVKKDGQQNG